MIIFCQVSSRWLESAWQCFVVHFSLSYTSFIIMGLMYCQLFHENSWVTVIDTSKLIVLPSSCFRLLVWIIFNKFLLLLFLKWALFDLMLITFSPSCFNTFFGFNSFMQFGNSLERPNIVDYLMFYSHPCGTVWIHGSRFGKSSYWKISPWILSSMQLIMCWMGWRWKSLVTMMEPTITRSHSRIMPPSMSLTRFELLTWYYFTHTSSEIKSSLVWQMICYGPRGIW